MIAIGFAAVLVVLSALCFLWYQAVSWRRIADYHEEELRDTEKELDSVIERRAKDLEIAAAQIRNRDDRLEALVSRIATLNASEMRLENHILERNRQIEKIASDAAQNGADLAWCKQLLYEHTTGTPQMHASITGRRFNLAIEDETEWQKIDDALNRETKKKRANSRKVRRPRAYGGKAARANAGRAYDDEERAGADGTAGVSEKRVLRK